MVRARNAAAARGLAMGSKNLQQVEAALLDIEKLLQAVQQASSARQGRMTLKQQWQQVSDALKAVATKVPKAQLAKAQAQRTIIFVGGLGSSESERASVESEMRLVTGVQDVRYAFDPELGMRRVLTNAATTACGMRPSLAHPFVVKMAKAVEEALLQPQPERRQVMLLGHSWGGSVVSRITEVLCKKAAAATNTAGAKLQKALGRLQCATFGSVYIPKVTDVRAVELIHHMFLDDVALKCNGLTPPLGSFRDGWYDPERRVVWLKHNMALQAPSNMLESLFGSGAQWQVHNLYQPYISAVMASGNVALLPSSSRPAVDVIAQVLNISTTGTKEPVKQVKRQTSTIDSQAQSSLNSSKPDKQVATRQTDKKRNSSSKVQTIDAKELEAWYPKYVQHWIELTSVPVVPETTAGLSKHVDDLRETMKLLLQDLAKTGAASWEAFQSKLNDVLVSTAWEEGKNASAQAKANRLSTKLQVMQAHLQQSVLLLGGLGKKNVSR